MKFGIELELFRPGWGSSPASPSAYDEDEDYYRDDDQSEPTTLCEDVLEYMRSERLTTATRLHGYHCDCGDCEYDRGSSEALMAAQQDSTVGAEFVSRILSTQSNQDMLDVRRLMASYPTILELGRWTPNGDDSNGNHIHVGWPAEAGYLDRAKAAAYINSMFTLNQDGWRRRADGGCGSLRGYNPAPARPWASMEDEVGPTGRRWSLRDDACPIGGGMWLSPRSGTNTLEFRLWNSPREASRLMVHPAMSCALMQAGLRWAETDGFDSAYQIFSWVENNLTRAEMTVVKALPDVWRHRISAAEAADLLAS